MKSKRGYRGRQDHVWEIVKHPPDLAIYARCKCGFEHDVGKDARGKDGTWLFPWEPDPNKMYRFCPNCGSRKTKYIEKIKVIEQ